MKYRVKVVSEVECGTIQQIKTAIPGISALNNITFEENGIRMWKAYGIGPGRYHEYFRHDLEMDDNTEE